jgi:Lon protease-like protein
MRRLPLFPLPVVLFPGDVMPLHIFEPRYRRMVARCLEYDRRFGLLFHDSDRQGPFAMEPDRVGTVAEIGEFRILPDGRSLLMAQGIERFRIVDGIEAELPYYEALVEPLHDPPAENAEALRLQRDHVMGQFERVLRAMDVGADRSATDPTATPAEGASVPTPAPEGEVSFSLAARIRTDPAWLHELLSTVGESRRLAEIEALLKQALGETS